MLLRLPVGRMRAACCPKLGDLMEGVNSEFDSQFGALAEKKIIDP
jgi:hypothetical protein